MNRERKIKKNERKCIYVDENQGGTFLFMDSSLNFQDLKKKEEKEEEK